MIEVAESQTYYYHYDGLGSVVALSDSSGDTVQTYEYSVYGQVAVEDINHPNPYMFAGRRFDIEIGLYYNRARYYNPYTGRFLQTDPIGYGGGMNLYAYCGNSPIGRTDPSGLIWSTENPDVWIDEDDTMFGVSASLVNVVLELYRREGWDIPDDAALEAMQTQFENDIAAQAGADSVDSYLDVADDVLNAYLEQNDPDNVLPRYAIREYNDESGDVWDHIEIYNNIANNNIVSVLGPVVYIGSDQGWNHAVTLLSIHDGIVFPDCDDSDSVSCGRFHYLWIDPEDYYEPDQVQSVSYNEARERSSKQESWDHLFLVPIDWCPRHRCYKDKCPVAH